MIRDKTTNKARRTINRLKKKLEKERLKRIYKSTKADRKKRWRNINNFKQKRFIEEMRKSQFLMKLFRGITKTSRNGIDKKQGQ